MYIVKALAICLVISLLMQPIDSFFGFAITGGLTARFIHDILVIGLGVLLIKI